MIKVDTVCVVRGYDGNPDVRVESDELYARKVVLKIEKSLVSVDGYQLIEAIKRCIND